MSFDIGKTSAEQLGAQAAIATQQEQQGSERGICVQCTQNFRDSAKDCPVFELECRKNLVAALGKCEQLMPGWQMLLTPSINSGRRKMLPNNGHVFCSGIPSMIEHSFSINAEVFFYQPLAKMLSIGTNMFSTCISIVRGISSATSIRPFSK